MQPLLYQVCIPHSGRDFYVYQTTTSPILKGIRVNVPFRNGHRLGIVIDAHQQPINFQAKHILEVLDHKPILSDSLLSLAKWLGAYYQSPLSEVLPLMLPKKIREGHSESHLKKTLVTLKINDSDALSSLPRNASKKKSLIEFIAQSDQWIEQQELIKQGFTKKLIQNLIEKDILQSKEEIALPYRPINTLKPTFKMNDEQHDAVARIRACFNTYQSFLLEGVTGSGKTEVYLQVLQTLLQQDKQALIIVPEIGLTPQLIARFHSRLASPIVVIHSALNDTERHQAWQLAKDGMAGVVIGTRSAIFTPLPKLGLIIIDEEHDASLKQMEGVRYSARDIAIFRAQQQQIPIVLGSATPSLESLNNVKKKKFQHLELHCQAIPSKPLAFDIIDIRNKSLHHGLAEQTIRAISHHLDKKEQVMIFINRRGFAPVLMCHQCGFMVDCKACDSHMTYHQHKKQLICHHCGLVNKAMNTCQSCHHQGLLPIGAGTQRIEEYLQARFNHHAVLRVDKDVTKNKQAMDKHLKAIYEGRADIIIGTQMLAKGHHFPNLTCVIILDADNGFYNQDFKALERLGQLIVQVAGRAGREEKPGHVLIQTHLPHHPLLNLLISQGYPAFAEHLLAERQNALLPPTYFMAVFRIQGRKQNLLLELLHQIKRQAASPQVQVLGPAPAPLARKNNQYRMQLLFKSSSRQKLHQTLTSLRTWLTMKKITSGIRWNIDVDPADLS